MEVIINHDYADSKHLEYLQELQSIFPVHSIHAPFFDVDGWGNKRDQLKVENGRIKLKLNQRTI